MVTSYSVDADFSTDVTSIAVGDVELPASCAISHTAGPNEVALVDMQVSIQFGAADALLIGPVFDDGTNTQFAVGFFELAGTGALNLANASTSARIPLTSGLTYTFVPGVTAAHSAGTALTVDLGTCHAKVSIVTDTAPAPLAAPGHGNILINPLTGVAATIK